MPKSQWTKGNMQHSNWYLPVEIVGLVFFNQSNQTFKMFFKMFILNLVFQKKI